MSLTACRGSHRHFGDEGIGCPALSINNLTSLMATEDRDLTRTYSRAQFVAKLRRLADTLEAGKPFTIQVAGEKLRIPADVVFNIEHERAGADEELEFQLIWTRQS